MISLKNHPFAVEAHFEKSIVLSYAVPKQELEDLIPECLSLDTHNDEFGFVAMAMVSTKELRPKGFPKLFGQDFYLIGYRIFVRYKTSEGKNLRGLYIIKSETDKRRMQFAGNIFTHYSYTTTDVLETIKEDRILVSSIGSDFSVEVDMKDTNPDLPTNSPFLNWKEARRFAGPLPFTFTYNEYKKEVLIIEGVRSNWKPRPIEVLKAENSFIDSFNFENVILANAFVIEDIPYYWKKGKVDKWIH